MRGLDYFRQKIQELELKAPVEKSDFYREYTKFILEKMKTVDIIDSEGKAVDPTVFFANPERAIAKIKEDRNLTLPVITVSIDDIDEDVDRRRTASNIEITTIWDKEERRAKRVISKASKPINISFTINVWAKYREDLNQIIENIMLMFNPSLDFKTKYATNTKAFIEQVTDNSVASAADREDRVLRKMIVVTAEAYLPSPKYLITSTGEIESLGLDFEFVSDGASNYRTMLALGGGVEPGEKGNSSSNKEIPNPVTPIGFDDSKGILPYLNRKFVLSDGYEMLMDLYIPKDRTEFSGEVPLIVHTPGTGGYRKTKAPSSTFVATALNPDPTNPVEMCLANGYAVVTYDIRGQATSWAGGGGGTDNSYLTTNLKNRTYAASAEFGAENGGVRELLDLFEIKDYVASGASWSDYIKGDSVGAMGNSLGGLISTHAAAWSGKTVPYLGITSSQTEFQSAMSGTDLSALDWGYTSSTKFSTFQAVSVQSFMGNDWDQFTTGNRFGFLTGPVRMFDLVTTAPRHLDKYETLIRTDDLSDFVSEYKTRAPHHTEFANATVPIITAFSYDDRQRGLEDYLASVAAYNGPKYFLACQGHHKSPKVLEIETLLNNNIIQWFDRYVKSISGAFKPTETFKFMETPDNVLEYRDYNSKRKYITSETSSISGLSTQTYYLSAVAANNNFRLGETSGHGSATIRYRPGASTYSFNSTGNLVDIIKATKAERTFNSQAMIDYSTPVDYIDFISSALPEDKLMFGQVSATFNIRSDASGMLGFEILELDKSLPVGIPNDGTSITNPRSVTGGAKGFNEVFSLNVNRSIFSRFQCYKFKKDSQIILRVKNHSRYEPPTLLPKEAEFKICPYFVKSNFDFFMNASSCFIKIPWKTY